MLTAKQSSALRFIEGYTREHGGVSPSFREIQVEVGCASTNSVFKIVNGLVERGYLRRLRDKQRALEVIDIPQRRKIFKFNDETKTLEPFHG